MTARSITDEDATFFHENGDLIVRGVVRGAELTHLRAAMDDLTDYGTIPIRDDDPDFMYGTGHNSGSKVLKRIEYVIDKRDECKTLLGNPYILRSVEKLIGPDLIPTWDSMVLKLPGEGIIVPWHRDAGTDYVSDKPIFNVDFYLDEANEETCVWLIPGSHLWPDDRIREEIASRGEWSSDGAVPALMQPGDVLFHNILVLHGSPANISKKLRRVIYYEFRPAHVEHEIGPHVPAYIPLKQRVLLSCIEHRKRSPYVDPAEAPFTYAPPEPFQTNQLPTEPLKTYRYAHADYWRK